MKTRLRSLLIATAALALACAPIVFLPACSDHGGTATTSPAPSPTPTGAAIVTPATVQTAATLATNAALQLAVQDASERAKVALACESAAHAVRTLATGHAVTPDEFQATVQSFGGPDVPQGYLVLAGSLTSLYSSYYPALTKGATAAQITAYTEAIAAGVEAGAAPYLPKS